jgi:putative tryptophan/tyrosine transport system substrate-binding protein
MSQVRRRQFLIAAGACSLSIVLPALAQQPGKLPRIGVLWHAGSAEEEGPYFRGLLEGFKNLGYIDGRNIILEHRFPNEVPERFASMAAELVASKVDVLIGVSAMSSLFVKRATATIPIVFVAVADPISSKLVESFARPGGNATGLANYAVELTGLRLQFLKELVPKLSRVAFLVNPDDKITPTFIDQAQVAAANLKITVQVFEARTLDELEPAFDAMVKARVQALSTAGGGLFFQGRAKFAKLAIARHLPTCGPTIEFLEAGTLMSYGPDQVAIFRRAAVYVDKILKGAKPADIPVEIPTKFEFLINAKTAKALGVKIPQPLLLRVNEVIE